MLISLRGEVNVKIIDGLTLDLVCMLMTLAIVPTQPESLGRGLASVDKYRREIENVEKALPENESKFRTICTCNFQLPLLVPVLRPQLQLALKARFELFRLAD